MVTAILNAQPKMRLDTIYANEHKNVALFFPNPIRQGITGADHFVFTYNREKQQYFGLLQATPGKESNLLIINNNGEIFSYIVRYSPTLEKLNYFIPVSASIGNEKPMESHSDKTIQPVPSADPKARYYERFCSYLVNRRQRIGKLKKRHDGMVMSIENIVFDREELYFVMTIENRSSLDYDVNFLHLSIETRKKGRKKSLQRLDVAPLYIYGAPSKIKEGQKAKVVYAVPKFSISDERLALLELNERNGERNLKLKISHRTINNPN
nr:DUF4138 domain-containing protein [Seonamhaeicola sp. S2-3]